MYANMLNRLKNYFGIENIFVEFSIHKMEFFKYIIGINNDLLMSANIMPITSNALTLSIFIVIALRSSKNLKTASKLNGNRFFIFFPLHSLNVNEHHLLPRALFRNGNLIHASYA